MRLNLILASVLIATPVNAQVVANRVNVIDGHVNHGDWIIPAGFGGALLRDQMNQPLQSRPGDSGSWDEPIGNMSKPQAQRVCEAKRKEYKMRGVRVVRDTQ
jgi:hypothetical protein